MRFKYYFYIFWFSVNLFLFIFHFVNIKKPQFHAFWVIQRALIPISSIEDNLIDKKTIFVSAYFELEKSKHLKSEYLVWIKRLLSIINCRIIIYTNKYFYLKFFLNETYQLPVYQQKLFNYNLTYSNAYEIPCVAHLSAKFEQMHIKDPLKNYHNSNLYAIWNSKTYLINSATFIYPDAYLYFWVDIGCVREDIMELQYDKNGNSYNKEEAAKLNNSLELTHIRFPFSNFSDYIKTTYTDPPLEMCLFFVYNHVFPKNFTGHFRQIIHVIQAGGFFGTKNGIRKFNQIFWKVQNDWLNRSFFSGVEQDLFNYIFVHYQKLFNFYVFPGFNQSHLYNGWFSFISAFSDRNPCNDHHYLLKPDRFLEK